jgi:hypothetical protein
MEEPKAHENHSCCHLEPVGMSTPQTHYIKPMPNYETEYEHAYIAPPASAYDHTAHRHQQYHSYHQGNKQSLLFFLLLLHQYSNLTLLYLLETKPTADHWQMLHKIVDELLKRNYEPHVLSALEEQVLHRRMDSALEHAYEHFKNKLAVIPDKNALPTSKTTHKTVWATDAEKVKHSACSQKQEHPSHIPVPVKGLHKEETSLEADATRTHELALENASDEELIKLCEHFISCLDVIKSA